MTIQSLTPILNVSSIKDSVTWFELFGWVRGFAWNGGGMIPQGWHENQHGPATFGSVCTNNLEIFLCVGAQGSRGTIMPKFPGDDETDGVWMSWWVESPAEVDQIYQVALDHGCQVTHPPTDEPWGVREMHLRHPDGHTFRVSSGIKKAS
jgi:uncharacterized glyoxalase superfamily protein PhnB